MNKTKPLLLSYHYQQYRFFLSILLFLLARYTNSFFYHFFRLLSFLFPVSNLTTFYEGSKRKRCSFDCFVLSLPSFFINILLSKRNAFFFFKHIFPALISIFSFFVLLTYLGRISKDPKEKRFVVIFSLKEFQMENSLEFSE